MTQYLNPMTMSKEAFLEKHGVRIDENDLKSHINDDRSVTCVVVLVDNGPFTAAGIICGEMDRRDFTDPNDFRPRSFYLVDTVDINNEGGVDGGVVT